MGRKLNVKLINRKDGSGIRVNADNSEVTDKTVKTWAGIGELKETIVADNIKITKIRGKEREKKK